MQPTITVEYSCAMCGAVNLPVEIEAREDSMDVVRWMQEVVQPALGRAHSTRACRSLTCDLRIPLPPDADYIGQPTKQ